MRTVYFDNAATSYPKPSSVRAAICSASNDYGGNPGRGGHSYSLRSAEMVYETRQLAAGMFKAKPENVVFTLNCTHSLNMAIKGIPGSKRSLVISSMEHNSVSRPAYAFFKRGARVDVARIGRTDEETLESFKRLIKPDTGCVVCTAASNVTGRIMPVREIARLCKDMGVPFIVDGAQAAGITELDLGMGMNFICVPGHKGLLGASGTGLLISDGSFALDTIIEGGTGATSAELDQTGFMPEHLESGTLNTVGIASLLAGLKFIESTGIGSVYNHEDALCDIFIDAVKDISGISLYRRGDRFVPIVSFNLDGLPSETVAASLSDMGFALRGGLHCAVLAHRTIGTLPNGTVRFSPSVFSSERDTLLLARAIKKLSKDGV